MKRICENCNQTFDDARACTSCPHEPLMSDRDLIQKDLAIALLGKPLHFAHQPGGDIHFIQTVDWTGMVTLRDMEGMFAPHLFIRAKDAE